MPNVIDLLEVTKAVVPHFRARHPALLINAFSVGGKIVFRLDALYHWTRFTVEGLAEALLARCVKSLTLHLARFAYRLARFASQRARKGRHHGEHPSAMGSTTMSFDTDLPVMVTGATGYVAGWLVKRLLDAGFTVHAAVRNPYDQDKIRHLERIAAGVPGTIRYFRADLLEPDSYADAMAGCSTVFHTASPFNVRVRDPQKELVDPALFGTRNVLETANCTPSVRRVVLTSSCAAIYGDNADLATTPDGVFNEAIWNTSSSLAHQPYSYSKTVAEREAWKIAGAQKRWDLVSINPSLVVGPGINPHATSESFEIVRQMGDGRMKMGAPDLRIGAVDVRDVADAHMRAAFTSAANGRYIVSGHDTSLPAMAATLLERYGGKYQIPRRILPKWLVWMVAPLTNRGITRRIVARNVGLPWRADNRRSRDELAIRYRPLAETMNDFFAQLIESGQLGR